MDTDSDTWWSDLLEQSDHAFAQRCIRQPAGTGSHVVDQVVHLLRAVKSSQSGQTGLNSIRCWHDRCQRNPVHLRKSVTCLIVTAPVPEVFRSQLDTFTDTVFKQVA